MGHSVIALQSIIKGLSKLEVNGQNIASDLQNNYVVVVEGIQTILRTINYPDPYNALKEFSRGKGQLTKEDIDEFIDNLQTSNEIKERLKAITPFNYVGK
jgi:adenylosuccinate lyase